MVCDQCTLADSPYTTSRVVTYLPTAQHTAAAVLLSTPAAGLLLHLVVGKPVGSPWLNSVESLKVSPFESGILDADTVYQPGQLSVESLDSVDRRERSFGPAKSITVG
jgi:hypothetical protein